MHTDEDKEITNLHALWDSVVTKYGKDLQQPLSAADFATLDKWAANIT